MYNVSNSLKFKICFLETYLKSQKIINDNILNTTLLCIIWKLHRKSFNVYLKNISALSIYTVYLMNAEKGNGTNSIVHKLANIHSYVIAKSQYTQNKSKRQEKGFPPPPYFLIPWYYRIKHVPTKIQRLLKLLSTQHTSATRDDFVHFWTFYGELLSYAITLSGVCLFLYLYWITTISPQFLFHIKLSRFSFNFYNIQRNLVWIHYIQ